MQQLEHRASFGGFQDVWTHTSKSLHCEMRFGIYLPPQVAQGPCPVLYWLSGLTCTEQNMITKAGAQRYAAEHGVIVVSPDTSPRGTDVPDDPSDSLGQAAGFYVNARREPWARHYQMYTYIVEELPALIESQFPATTARSITGHSMGGHGAMICALRNPGRYKSVSAFAPIAAPSQVSFGTNAFGAYLGEDRALWAEWDATELVASAEERLPILIDQGANDPFFPELRPDLFVAAAEAVGHPIIFRNHAGYDHSYYFVASFAGDHMAYHARALHRAV